MNTNSVQKAPLGFAKSLVTKYFSLSAMLLLLIAFSMLSPDFLTPDNLGVLLSDQVPTMMMAAGMTFILLMGSIDLSVGSACMVGNVICVKMMQVYAGHTSSIFMITFLTIVTVLAFGALAGLILGILNVKFKISSFIGSLAMMSVWKTVGLVINARPESVPKNLRPIIAWGQVSIGAVTVTFLISLGLYALLYVIQSRSELGKSTYAIGCNERAARMSGINVGLTKIKLYVLSGLCTASASIFLTMKIKHSSPQIGDSFTLPVIAAVVLGGTSLSGGRGSIFLTILGTVSVAIIDNGMNVVGVDVLWQDIIFGVIILCSVALTVNRSDRNIIIK